MDARGIFIQLKLFMLPSSETEVDRIGSRAHDRVATIAQRVPYTPRLVYFVRKKAAGICTTQVEKMTITAEVIVSPMLVRHCCNTTA